MRVYQLRLKDQDGAFARDVNFEAADDAAALDLTAHYYPDEAGELRHDGQLIRAFERTPGAGGL